jgi:hypothetical protein
MDLVDSALDDTKIGIDLHNLALDRDNAGVNTG